MSILLTGGAGYIGTHTALALLQAGEQVVVLDNLHNAHGGALLRVESLAGKAITFIEGDIRDTGLIASTLERHRCEAVIHLAGLKAVDESVQEPLRYYDTNVWGAISLLKAMEQSGVRTLVFSSSATVYGTPQYLPYDEQHPTSPVNTYGRTKLHIEHMLQDCAHAPTSSGAEWRIVSLRYFNPVGAHESGLIGENPRGIPNNLMPLIAQVASKQLETLQIFGDDYDTPDGTGIRDYIHVMDLAQGHVAALQYLRHSTGLKAQSRTAKTDNPHWLTVNLGTGNGYSVREVVRAFEQASGTRIPCKISARRPGDLAECYADTRLAFALLGWRAARGLATICTDHWRWLSQNPNGYEAAP